MPLCIQNPQKGSRPEAVSAWAITVAPGSAFVDVDWDSDEMLVHVIEAENGDVIREAINGFYDRYQKKVFP